MEFGAHPPESCVGAITVHGIRSGDIVIRKGSLLTADDVARLSAAGIERIVVARLDVQDVPENEAAFALAGSLAGPGLRVDASFTGRANIHALEAGVMTIDAAAINAVNAIDEAVTVATLPRFRAVRAGEMVATVKIIPFGVEKSALETAIARAKEALALAPYRPQSIGVISTVLPSLRRSVIAKTLRVFTERLEQTGSTLDWTAAVAHRAEALASAIRDAVVAGSSLVVVFGASAIADRRDVIPAAVLACGGTIEHFGMPVDPGNLLLIGRIGDVPVIGAPGCARSPKENGFDWVLQRLLADIPVTRDDIQAMGVGGLLTEIMIRPQPRGGTGA